MNCNPWPQTPYSLRNSHIASQSIKQQAQLILNLNPCPLAHILQLILQWRCLTRLWCSVLVASLGTVFEAYLTCAPVFTQHFNFWVLLLLWAIVSFLPSSFPFFWVSNVEKATRISTFELWPHFLSPLRSQYTWSDRTCAVCLALSKTKTISLKLRMFTSLSRHTLYKTWNADIILHHKPTTTGSVWVWRWNVKYPHALLMFLLFLIIHSIPTLDKAVINKTHELQREDNPFALWIYT